MTIICVWFRSIIFPSVTLLMCIRHTNTHEIKYIARRVYKTSLWSTQCPLLYIYIARLLSVYKLEPRLYGNIYIHLLTGGENNPSFCYPLRTSNMRTQTLYTTGSYTHKYGISTFIPVVHLSLVIAHTYVGEFEARQVLHIWARRVVVWFIRGKTELGLYSHEMNLTI